MSTALENFADCHALPIVAVPFMNAVHCEELALVGKLLSELHTQPNVIVCDSLFATWIQHTQEHFAREERLMQEHDFFAYPCHQGEHQKALQELCAVHQYWLNERDTVGIIEYIGQWRNWLQEHISTMDFVTAQYLSQFDLDPHRPKWTV